MAKQHLKILLVSLLIALSALLTGNVLADDPFTCPEGLPRDPQRAAWQVADTNDEAEVTICANLLTKLHPDGTVAQTVAPDEANMLFGFNLNQESINPYLTEEGWRCGHKLAQLWKPEWENTEGWITTSWQLFRDQMDICLMQTTQSGKGGKNQRVLAWDKQVTCDLALRDCIITLLGTHFGKPENVTVPDGWRFKIMTESAYGGPVAPGVTEFLIYRYVRGDESTADPSKAQKQFVSVYSVDEQVFWEIIGLGDDWCWQTASCSTDATNVETGRNMGYVYDLETANVVTIDPWGEFHDGFGGLRLTDVLVTARAEAAQ